MLHYSTKHTIHITYTISLQISKQKKKLKYQFFIENKIVGIIYAIKIQLTPQRLLRDTDQIFDTN